MFSSGSYSIKQDPKIKTAFKPEAQMASLSEFLNDAIVNDTLDENAIKALGYNDVVEYANAIRRTDPKNVHNAYKQVESVLR